MQLETYFTDDQIIRQLSKKRIKRAKVANDRQVLQRLIGKRPDSASRP
jgi:hypothetical protein